MIRLEREQSAMPPASVAWSALGHDFSISVPDPRLAEYLDRVFGSLETGTPDSASHRYEIVGVGSTGYWQATRDGLPLGPPGSKSHALGLLLWGINRGVIGARPHAVKLHAGAIRLGDRTFLLPGGMEVGKSTLVAGALQVGACYLTDEAVELDLTEHRVQGFPKALSLDPGSWPLFPELEPHVPRVLSEWLPRQWQVPPAEHGVRVVREAAPDVVVFPQYRQGAETSLRPLGPGPALVRLMASVFPTMTPRVAVLRRLAKLIGHVPTYELVSGELHGAVAHLRRIATPMTPAVAQHNQTATTVRSGSRTDGASGAAVCTFGPVTKQRFRARRDGVSGIPVRDHLVLHIDETDELFELNALGAAIWDAIRQRAASVEELTGRLSLDESSAQGNIHNAVLTLVAELAALGLLTREEDGAHGV